MKTSKKENSEKAGLILFLMMLLIVNIFLIQVKAEEIDPETGLPVTIKKVSDAGKNLTDKEQNTSYVAEQWRKTLLENPLGYAAVKIWDFSKPPLTFIIGKKAEFSWGFAIAVAIWVCILFFAKYIFSNFSLFSERTAWISSLCLVIIMSIIKLTETIAEFLDNLSSKWWGKLVIILVIIIIIAIFSVIRKYTKEIREKQQVEEDKAKLHAAAGGAEGFKKAGT